MDEFQSYIFKGSSICLTDPSYGYGHKDGRWNIRIKPGQYWVKIEEAKQLSAEPAAITMVHAEHRTRMYCTPKTWTLLNEEDNILCPTGVFGVFDDALYPRTNRPGDAKGDRLNSLYGQACVGTNKYERRIVESLTKGVAEHKRLIARMRENIEKRQRDVQDCIGGRIDAVPLEQLTREYNESVSMLTRVQEDGPIFTEPLKQLGDRWALTSHGVVTRTGVGAGSYPIWTNQHGTDTVALRMQFTNCGDGRWDDALHEVFDQWEQKELARYAGKQAPPRVHEKA